MYTLWQANGCRPQGEAMRSAIAILVCAAVLLGAAGVVVQAQPSLVAAPVTLDANGWSDPSVGGWDGHTATLNRDLAQGIVIAASGVVLDGAGHTVSGGGRDSGSGVYAQFQTGLTIRNLRVTNFDYGIYLDRCSGATLENNTLSGNAVAGITLFGGNRHVLTGNTATGNAQAGIDVANCPLSRFTGNAMADNGLNFRISGKVDSDYNQDIDASNTVQGKALLYVVGANGATFDASSNAGAVYLINCSGVTVKGLALSRNDVGVLLWKTSNSRLEGLQVSASAHGIWLRNGSNGNTLQGNTIDGSGYGIYVEGSSSNVVTDNEIRGSGSYGLYLSNASGTRTFHNRFLANRTHAYGAGGSGNVFNEPKPEGGNFWDDWTGPDADGDGFVDVPRVFTGGSDGLPLSGAPKADRLAPLTTAVLEGTMGGGGWYRSDVRVTLMAGDNEGGSGVKSTEYNLNGGPWQPYAAPFTISQEGVTALAFRSTDNAGNVEGARSLEIRIDKTAPEITISCPQPGDVLPSGTALSFGARDAVSGLAGISASLFDGLNKWAVSSGDTVTLPGVYDLAVLANDVAGNSSSLERTFVVPSAEAASVTGGGWISTGDGKSAENKAFLNVVCQNRRVPGTPVGEFSFRDGNLSVKGTGFHWLVVRDDVAWFEGTGTASGVGNCRFQVVVQEGKKASEPDRVRVRIWDQGAHLIYDSQPGASDWAGPTAGLSGGNLTIHKG